MRTLCFLIHPAQTLVVHMIPEAGNRAREAGAAFDRAEAVGTETPEAGQGECDWWARTAHGGRHPTPT